MAHRSDAADARDAEQAIERVPRPHSTRRDATRPRSSMPRATTVAPS
jgi:hypothetical protein